MYKRKRGNKDNKRIKLKKDNQSNNKKKSLAWTQCPYNYAYDVWYSICELLSPQAIYRVSLTCRKLQYLRKKRLRYQKHNHKEDKEQEKFIPSIMNQIMLNRLREYMLQVECKELLSLMSLQSTIPCWLSGKLITNLWLGDEYNGSLPSTDSSQQQIDLYCLEKDAPIIRTHFMKVMNLVFIGFHNKHTATIKPKQVEDYQVFSSFLGTDRSLYHSELTEEEETNALPVLPDTKFYYFKYGNAACLDQIIRLHVYPNPNFIQEEDDICFYKKIISENYPWSILHHAYNGSEWYWGNLHDLDQKQITIGKESVDLLKRQYKDNKISPSSTRKTTTTITTETVMDDLIHYCFRDFTFNNVKYKYYRSVWRSALRETIKQYMETYYDLKLLYLPKHRKKIMDFISSSPPDDDNDGKRNPVLFKSVETYLKKKKRKTRDLKRLLILIMEC